MKTHSWIIVATALVLALGVGIGLSQAGTKKKHDHSTPVKLVTKDFSVAPGDDGSEIVFCPRGWKAIGGGIVPAVPEGFGFPLVLYSGLAAKLGYLAAVFNQTVTNTTSRMEVQATCIKGTGKAKASASQRQQLRKELDQRVEQFQAERR